MGIGILTTHWHVIGWPLSTAHLTAMAGRKTHYAVLLWDVMLCVAMTSCPFEAEPKRQKYWSVTCREPPTTHQEPMRFGSMGLWFVCVRRGKWRSRTRTAISRNWLVSLKWLSASYNDWLATVRSGKADQSFGIRSVIFYNVLDCLWMKGLAPSDLARERACMSCACPC